MTRTEMYVGSNGNCPFDDWFGGLDSKAAAKVTSAITRMESGNFSNAKGIGGGVSEYAIDFGPGYRIYYGQDGDALILLLIGGTKRRQQRDIDLARRLWMEYKSRKE